MLDWLGKMDRSVDAAQYWNLQDQLTSLTAAGLVQRDEVVVFCSEFLEWLVSNLRPAFRLPKESDIRVECLTIVRDAISSVKVALSRPDLTLENVRSLVDLRMRATLAQQMYLHEVFHKETALPPGLVIGAGGLE